MASGDRDYDGPEDEDFDDGEEFDDGLDLDGDDEGDDGDEGVEDEASGRGGRGRLPKAKAAGRGRGRAGRKAVATAKVSGNSIGFDKKGKLEFEIGGLSSGKIAVIAAALSTVVGALWGGFQVYQQFLTMQKVTAAYVPPDLSGINSQISVLNERVTSVERLTKGNSEALNYLTGSIGSSINGTRQTVDAVSSTIRSSDTQNVAMQRQIIEQLRQQDQEQQRRLKELERWTDDKIKHVLANPLAGKD